MTTGQDLKLRRIALDVTANDLAERAKLHRSTVARWESARRVPADAAKRYLEALATFGTIPTVTVESGEPAA